MKTFRLIVIATHEKLIQLIFSRKKIHRKFGRYWSLAAETKYLQTGGEIPVEPEKFYRFYLRADCKRPVLNSCKLRGCDEQVK